MRATINAKPDPDGVPPIDAIGVPLQCWDADPANAARDLADWDANNGDKPRITMSLGSSVDAHATDIDPLAYFADDYVLRFGADLFDDDGVRWTFVYGPEGYDGATALSRAPIPALAIARRALPPVVDKTRSIQLQPGNGTPGVDPPVTWCLCDAGSVPSSLRVRLNSIGLAFNMGGIQYSGATPFGEFEMIGQGTGPFYQLGLFMFQGTNVDWMSPSGSGSSNKWNLSMACFTDRLQLVLGWPADVFTGFTLNWLGFATNPGEVLDCSTDWPRRVTLQFAGTSQGNVLAQVLGI